MRSWWTISKEPAGKSRVSWGLVSSLGTPGTHMWQRNLLSKDAQPVYQYQTSIFFNLPSSDRTEGCWKQGVCCNTRGLPTLELMLQTGNKDVKSMLYSVINLQVWLISPKELHNFLKSPALWLSPIYDHTVKVFWYVPKHHIFTQPRQVGSITAPSKQIREGRVNSKWAQAWTSRAKGIPKHLPMKAFSFQNKGAWSVD